MLAKTGCKRKDEAKKKYLKHSEEKLHQPIGIVMIYDDCDEMVTIVNVVVMVEVVSGAKPDGNGEDDDKMIYDDGGGGDVGGGAEPEGNGEDDDKILSHCLELDKSGGQCWAGSDPEPRIWLKQLLHQRHLKYLSIIIITINSNY